MMKNRVASPPWTGLGMLGGTIAIFIAEALILPTGFITAVFLARHLGPGAHLVCSPSLRP